MRFSLPNSRIMIHQPSGGYQGQVTDIEIQTNEIIKTKKRLNEIYSQHTGKNISEIESEWAMVFLAERDSHRSRRQRPARHDGTGWKHRVSAAPGG